MSYSPIQALDERSLDVNIALSTRDSEALYHLARLCKEEGDDEKAEALYKQARQFDKEDMAFDEARDNLL